MAKQGAGKKVGKGKTGKDKDFAGSGVEGGKGSAKEPDTDQQKRLVLIVDHLAKLNFELTNIAIVLETVQVEIPDATEAEVITAIDMFNLQQEGNNSSTVETPPEMPIAERIVRVKEILAELDMEDVVLIISAVDSGNEPDERIVTLLSEKINFPCEEEDFIGALKQFQNENSIETELTDKEAQAKAHIGKIVETIGELDPSDPKDYTNQGKPDSNVLADILDAKVSAADRDKAWKIYQAEDRPITIDQIIKGKRRKGMKI